MLNIEPFLWREFEDLTPYGNPTTDWRVDCPKCDDTKGHLHVAIFKQTFHCFRCDYKGSWIRLVMDSTGYDYYRALGELYVVPNPQQFDTIESQFSNVKEKKIAAYDVDPTTVPTSFIPLWHKGHEHYKLLIAMRSYMKSRGFFQDVWEKYSIGYVPDFGARIYIPIEGNYWQARSIFPFHEPKYIGPDIPSLRVLGNAKALYIYNEVIVTEGVLSGIAVGPNHVALIGKNPTKQKIERLVKSNVRKFIITVEPEAVDNMFILADALDAHGKDVELWMYEGGDPADSEPVWKVDYGFDAKINILLNT